MFFSVDIKYTSEWWHLLETHWKQTTFYPVAYKPIKHEKMAQELPFRFISPLLLYLLIRRSTFLWHVLFYYRHKTCIATAINGSGVEQNIHI